MEIDKQYWLNKWQANDVAFHEDNVTLDLIAYILYLNLHPGDCIFIPLCGKSLDIAWFASQGFRVVGVELSPIACADFFKELQVKPHIVNQGNFTKYQYKNIELLCGDIFNLTGADLPTIHAIYDSKALIALPEDLRKQYVEHIIACTGTNIKVLLITRESPCQIKPPPFSVSKEEVDSLFSQSFDVKRLKHEQVLAIPERLVKKGYREMTLSVYLMTRKNCQHC